MSMIFRIQFAAGAVSPKLRFIKYFRTCISLIDNLGSWIRRGAIFPSNSWNKYGAPLFATPENGLPKHLLYWGECNVAGAIFIAYSFDAMNWTDHRTLLLETRNDSFDSLSVQAGSPPLRLASGDYLFIYNSARYPNRILQYNLGYAILDGSNPSNILHRSDRPLLSPELEWEVGTSSEYLAKNTVFLGGLVEDPNGCPADVGTLVGPEYAENAECFFGAYGAANTVVGAVRIVASWIILANATTSASTTTASLMPTEFTTATNVVSTFSTTTANATSTILNADSSTTTSSATTSSTAISSTTILKKASTTGIAIVHAEKPLLTPRGSYLLIEA